VRTDPDGVAAVRRARAIIAAAVGAPGAGGLAPPLPEGFDEPRGVFVTIRRHPSGALRGCIGYPLPRYPLGIAIDRAARSAALGDPRFPSLRPAELAAVTIEVSVLTVPERLAFATPEEAIRSVRVGRDGLIVEAPGASGLLLPQVAPEQGWSAEQLLEGTCEKAGLPPTAWRTPSVQIYRFEAEAFGETTPSGPVERTDTTATSGDERHARRT